MFSLGFLFSSGFAWMILVGTNVTCNSEDQGGSISLIHLVILYPH